jgi:L-alanine-DL-glutamate epimerase-like enolase superfamily enzyme
VALTLTTAVERFPIAGAFTIARGSKTEAVVVTASVSDGVHTGRGECVPYARYGETVEGVRSAIDALAPAFAAGLDRAGLQAQLPPGAARNAIDCALWDLAAKRSNRRVFDLAGLPAPEPVITCYTISLGEPQIMAEAARRAEHLPLLKLKLGATGDIERLRAVRAARPDVRLVVDANEGWSIDILPERLSTCADLGIELVEQPLPAGADAPLADIDHRVPICADESVHAELEGIVGLYDAINVKLDKTGGLTGAVELAAAARAAGLDIMVGCMVGTSLAMTPALLLAPFARWTDLDGPLLLARDRKHGLSIVNGVIAPAPQALWG